MNKDASKLENSTLPPVERRCFPIRFLSAPLPLCPPNLPACLHNFFSSAGVADNKHPTVPWRCTINNMSRGRIQSFPSDVRQARDAFACIANHTLITQNGGEGAICMLHNADIILPKPYVGPFLPPHLQDVQTVSC